MAATIKLIKNPGDHKEYRMRAFANYNLKDYKAAKDDYDSAIALDPDNAIYYSNRSLAEFKLADYPNRVKVL